MFVHPCRVAQRLPDLYALSKDFLERRSIRGRRRDLATLGIQGRILPRYLHIGVEIFPSSSASGLNPGIARSIEARRNDRDDRACRMNICTSRNM